MSAYNASGPITMVDNLKYITIANSVSGVNLFVSKENLIIQRDSNSSFFVKNESYVCYYNYSDVSTPVSTSVDNLISILISYVNNYIPQFCTNGYVPLVTHAVSASYIKPTSDVVSNGTVDYPVFTLKVPSSSSTTAQLRTLNVLNMTSDSIAQWKLVLNGTLTGSTFSSISGSQLQESVSETVCTGSNIVASGFIYNISATSHDLSYVPLGFSNTLTFVASSLKGSPELRCSIDWSEDAP